MKQRDRNWLSVHAYAKILGEVTYRTVLFWYAFVGCDVVSQFLRKGKKTAWNTWGRLLETTETFIRLLCISKLSESNIKIKENLFVLMYDASCTHTQVSGCRKYLFSKLNHTIDQCPPAMNAPEQHILRTMPQRYLWPKSTQLKEQSFTVTDWDGMLTSVGMSIHYGQHYWSFQSMQNNAKKLQVQTFVFTWHVYL